MERYCADRSAEYELRAARDGGTVAAKQCFLYGTPQLAAAWAGRTQAFFPEAPGGVMAIYPRHGWSFIRIPGMTFEPTLYFGVVGGIWSESDSMTKSNSTLQYLATSRFKRF